jgi:hypothetical protein
MSVERHGDAIMDAVRHEDAIDAMLLVDVGKSDVSGDEILEAASTTGLVLDLQLGVTACFCSMERRNARAGRVGSQGIFL